MFARFAFASIAIFGAGSYITYKFQEAKRFKEQYFDTLPDKRQFLLQKHQSAAYTFDKQFDSYENQSKITSYRKTLASLCKGLILETGVGTSRNLKFYPPGSKIIAVDWSNNALEVAIQKPAMDINVEYRLEDVEQLSFQDNTFDTIIDTFGMEYYLDPKKVLNEMKRVCKKGGQILLMTTGRSYYDMLNLYQELKVAQYLSVLGQFPNRDWDNIIKDPELEIIKEERKINGTVYLFILENNKK